MSTTGGYAEGLWSLCFQRFAQCTSQPVTSSLLPSSLPGQNDSPDKMGELASWVASLSPEIPLHVSRYFPGYRMSDPRTPLATMEKCVEAAKEHLDYVYVGNASIPGGQRYDVPRVRRAADREA